jgi:hypothetical protein
MEAIGRLPGVHGALHVAIEPQVSLPEGAGQEAGSAPGAHAPPPSGGGASTMQRPASRWIVPDASIRRRTWFAWSMMMRSPPGVYARLAGRSSDAVSAGPPSPK